LKDETLRNLSIPHKLLIGASARLEYILLKWMLRHKGKKISCSLSSCADFFLFYNAGNDHVYTPHLDYLISQGTLFTKCYSDYPICMTVRTACPE